MAIKTKNRVTARVTAVLKGTKVEPGKTVFRIPKEDEALIGKLRQYLNGQDFILRVRFRGPRKGSAYQTVKENAQWFAIYIDRK